VAERNVAQVVHQGREPQALLDELDRGSIRLAEIGACPKRPLPDDQLLGVAQAKSAVLVHEHATGLEDLHAFLVTRVAQCRSEEPRREMHRPKAVGEPRHTHLGKHEVRGSGLTHEPQPLSHGVIEERALDPGEADISVDRVSHSSFSGQHRAADRRMRPGRHRHRSRSPRGSEARRRTRGAAGDRVHPRERSQRVRKRAMLFPQRLTTSQQQSPRAVPLSLLSDARRLLLKGRLA
jgi:hypothetical protein